jgi:hypothetical protein
MQYDKWFTPSKVIVVPTVNAVNFNCYLRFGFGSSTFDPSLFIINRLKHHTIQKNVIHTSVLCEHHVEKQFRSRSGLFADVHACRKRLDIEVNFKCDTGLKLIIILELLLYFVTPVMRK